jgi:hypothetical protein
MSAASPILEGVLPLHIDVKDESAIVPSTAPHLAPWP